MSMNRGNKKRQRVISVLLIILAVILAAVIAVLVWQKNNIEALKLYMSQSREDIENQLSENDAYVNELLEKLLNDARGPETDFITESSDSPDVGESSSVETDTAEIPGINTETAEPTFVETDVREEDRESIPETSPVHTEADTEPHKDTEAVTEAVTESEPSKAPEETKSDMSSYEAELQVLVNKVYELRKEYIAQLDALYAQAVAAYKAIPEAERTTKKLATFASGYISKGTALEKECDGKMDSLVKEFRALLKKYNKSTEIINEVKLAYAREKSLKKALYMSELERRGFI